MCGILGQINLKDKIDLNLFKDRLLLMNHRGPDHLGIHRFKEDRIIFGHNRLSILDLSQDGNQPMLNDQKTIAITFNGEIYNFRELKRLLEPKYKFRSQTDTEVILKGYEEWGIIELCERLKGMFSFSIYDENTNKIYLVRDRIGIKPLYYSFTESEFEFSSEIKSISNSKKTEMNHSAIADFFIYSYIPTPNTVWKQVKKLEPGSILELDTDYWKTNTIKYWELKEGNIKTDDDKAFKVVESLLKTSVSQHLISDVPIGLFLSGGYDSTLLLKLMKDHGTNPQTFTLAFKNHENDEYDRAKKIANYYGVGNTKIEINEDFDLCQMLFELSDFYDEPFAGSSMVNNFLISRVAGKEVKVCFSGEGADEVFGGYKWYNKIDNHYRGGLIKRCMKALKKGVLLGKEEFLELYNRSMIGVLPEDNLSDILSTHITDSMKIRNVWYFEKFYDESKRYNQVKTAQFIDIHSFVVDHCLCRADVSSMASSLELRVPYLDHELVNYMFSLNKESYFKKDTKKFYIHEILKRDFSRDFLNDPKKGFSFQFYGNSFKKELDRILTEGILIEQGILKTGINSQSISDNFKIHIVCLEYWFEKNHYQFSA